ncbi:ACT domain-containing protein [Halomonas sp. WWR20]
MVGRPGLVYDFVAAWITLEVHSAPEAVGLTAAFAQALSEEQIRYHIIAGFYHDHLFVAHPDAEKAMATLRALSHRSGR